MTKQEFLQKAGLLYDKFSANHKHPANGFILTLINNEDTTMHAGGIATTEQIRECGPMMEAFIIKSMDQIQAAAKDGDPKGLILAVK